MGYGRWLFYFSGVDLPILQIQVKMKYVSNNLGTFILLKVHSSTHIPCVHLGRSCVQSSSQAFIELLLYVGE